MLHAPLLSRRAPAPSATAMPLPLAPADYLALRRKASGLRVSQVAALIATSAGAQAELRCLLRLLETRGVVARKPETLGLLATAFSFDADVYRQLATEPADRHPRICLGCGCSDHDACQHEPTGNCSWAGADVCSRCTDGEYL